LSRRGGTVGFAVFAVAAVIVAGALTGLVWSVVVSPTQLRKTAGGLVLDEVAGATSFGATGWFCVTTGAVGLAIGAVVAPVARRAASVSVALSGLVLAMVAPVVAALIAWWVGQRLGAGPSPAQVAAVVDGGSVAAPLRLGTPVALAVAPLLAVVVVVAGSLWPARWRRDPSVPVSPGDQ